MKLKIKLTTLFIISVAFLPIVTSADAGVTDIKTLVAFLIGLINSIIPLLFGVAALVFMWGVIKYIASSDPKKLAEGRNFIIFGIVGIAVMLSIWALALFVKNSFFPGVPTPLNSTPTPAPDFTSA